MISEPQVQKSTLLEQAQASIDARKEMSMDMAKMHIKCATTYNVRAAVDRKFILGDKILVLKEEQVEHRIGGWLDPFEVMSHDQARKQIHVKDTSRKLNITVLSRKCKTTH